MDGPELLHRMKDAYANCSSYSDSGNAEIFDAARTRVTRVEFSTFYVKPMRMRFEWRRVNAQFGNPERLLSIESDGVHHFEDLEIDDGQPTEPDSLSMALAGAVGLSAGAADKVLTLLIEELQVERIHLLMLNGLEVIAEESLQGKDCYVLQGVMATGDYELWISSDDFSLRRLRRKTGVESDRFVGEYNYIRAVFNEPVPTDAFQNV